MESDIQGNANGISSDVHVYTQPNINEKIQIRRREIREALKSNITLHGFHYLENEVGIRKIAWILIMLLAVILSVTLFFHTIQDFPSESITEFSIQKNVKEHNFPTITICDTNSPVIAVGSYDNFPVNVTEKEFVEFYDSMISPSNYKAQNISSPSVNSFILEELYLLNYTSYKDIQGLFEKQSSEEIFGEIINLAVQDEKCRFGSSICNVSDFKETLHWDYSTCHQFNPFIPNKISKTTKSKSGYLNGLQFITNLISHKEKTFTPVYGLKLFIHPYGTAHHLREFTSVVFAQPGSYTQMELEITETQRLPEPYENPCGESTYKIVRYYPYSEDMCQIDIIMYHIFERCHCVGWEWDGLVDDDIPICDVKGMICYYRERGAGVGNKFENGASHNCPVECKTIKYSVVSSTLSFGDHTLYKRVLNIPGYNKSYAETKEYIKENVVALYIGFKSLSKLVERYEPAVSWYGLIGTVGGSIGLCLGFSLITVFEAIFYIFDYIYAPWYVRKKLGKISHNSVNKGI